jgi:hypothetical protein
MAIDTTAHTAALAELAASLRRISQAAPNMRTRVRSPLRRWRDEQNTLLHK